MYLDNMVKDVLNYLIMVFSYKKNKKYVLFME